MTRINVGIPVKELNDQHLRAEHREIKRIPNHLKKFGEKCIGKGPANFKLGQGHVLFFIDKGLFTWQRYRRLRAECLERGFKVSDFSTAWNVYWDYQHLYNNWEPSQSDIELIKERINERLKEMKPRKQRSRT